MRRTTIAIVTAAGLSIVLGAFSAMAGPKGLGGGGAPTTPPGFSSPGGHNGFGSFTNTSPSTTPGGTPTTTTEMLPRGWGEGNASWKSTLEQPNPTLSTRPPGLSGH